MTDADRFDAMKSRDIRNERRIFWSEVAILLGLVMLVTGYLVPLALAAGFLSAPPW